MVLLRVIVQFVVVTWILLIIFLLFISSPFVEFYFLLLPRFPWCLIWSPDMRNTTWEMSKQMIVKLLFSHDVFPRKRFVLWPITNFTQTWTTLGQFLRIKLNMFSFLPTPKSSNRYNRSPRRNTFIFYEITIILGVTYSTLIHTFFTFKTIFLFFFFLFFLVLFF